MFSIQAEDKWGSIDHGTRVPEGLTEKCGKNERWVWTGERNHRALWGEATARAHKRGVSYHRRFSERKLL